MGVLCLPSDNLALAKCANLTAKRAKMVANLGAICHCGGVIRDID